LTEPGFVDGIMAGFIVIRQSETILGRFVYASGAEQSGLLTRIATTESVSLCGPMKS
jgi:hypothetical protein